MGDDSQVYMQLLIILLVFSFPFSYAVYIGSSINIGNRLVDHLVTNNTNGHLKSALNSYGLKNFTFCVVEFCDLEVLLQRRPLRRTALSRYSFPPLPVGGGGPLPV